MGGQVADALAGMEGDERLGVSTPIARSNQRLQQCGSSGGSGGWVLEAALSAERTIETVARENARGVAVGEHAEAFQFGPSNTNPWIGRSQASTSGDGEGALRLQHGTGECLGKRHLEGEGGTGRLGRQQLVVWLRCEVEQRADQSIVVQVGIGDEWCDHGRSC
jgi:hypothetical protein